MREEAGWLVARRFDQEREQEEGPENVQESEKPDQKRLWFSHWGSRGRSVRSWPQPQKSDHNFLARKLDKMYSLLDHICFGRGPQNMWTDHNKTLDHGCVGKVAATL